MEYDLYSTLSPLCYIYLTHSPHFRSHHTIYNYTYHASFNYSQHHKNNQMLFFHPLPKKKNLPKPPLPSKAVDLFIVNIPSAFLSFAAFPSHHPVKDRHGGLSRPPGRRDPDTLSESAFKIGSTRCVCLRLSPCRVTAANSCLRYLNVLNELRVDERRELKIHIDKTSFHRDILGSLPLELAVQITSNLEIADLFSLQSVCLPTLITCVQELSN